MSQTQTITSTSTIRLKLPPSKLKLPIGVPPKGPNINEVKVEVKAVEVKVEVKEVEVKAVEIPIRILPLDAQLGTTTGSGDLTISKIPNSVDPVTAPHIRPTLQNPTMVEAFNHTITKSEKAQILKSIITEENKLPQFEVLGTDLRLISFAELKKTAVYEVTNDKDAGLGSVNDPRGGVVDDDSVCGTCRKDNFNCPGHPGIIIFKKPMIHPKGVPTVIGLLKAVCKDSGTLKITRQALEDNGILKKTGMTRFDAVVELAESMICPYIPKEGECKCGPNPQYDSKTSKETNIIFYSEKVKGKKEKKLVPFDTEDVLKLLKSISDEDAELLGFIKGSRPEDLIMQGLYVIPPISRTLQVRDGIIWPHHLTLMYKDIASNNLKITGTPGNKPTENDVLDAYSQLIFQVRHFMDNTDKKYTYMSSKPFDSIKDIIQGKEGIINNLLLGKRVNFVARTVISPDTSLKFGQVRIPKIWESVLTIRVKIFKENLPSMLLLWKEGRITHYTPGSDSLQGSRIQVTENTKSKYAPKTGDTVERWCKNGDMVLFNRQPTIQKEGMMGYEIVLGEGNTIGLHLAACHPHNADMDGDESQVHMLQALDAVIEALKIVNTKECLVNAQSNKAMGNVPMDANTAFYMMSVGDKVQMSQSDFDTYTSVLTNREALDTLDIRLQKYKVLPLTTRALISTLFPVDFNYRKGTVLILEGIFVQGTMTKGQWGPVTNSIPMEIHQRYGITRTTDLLTDAPYLANNWLLDNPFSIKYSDCFIEDPKHEKFVQEQIRNARFLVESIQNRRANRIANESKMSLPENSLEYEREEAEIKNALNNAKNVAVKSSMENLPKTNSLVISASAGTKGGAIEIDSITGVLGQQYVQGSRMPKTMTKGTRCLPYFFPGETSIESSGFCTNSFIKGLTVAELFFTAIAGRESAINTATSVPTSGFISKRIVKNLEDLTIKNNGTVTNSNGMILSFAYGGDGFDPGKLSYVSTASGNKLSFINLKAVSDELNQKYGYGSKNL